MTTKTAEQQAQEAQEKHPDAWIATSEGDTLEGEIVNVAFGWSDQKMADYPILTVRQQDGTEKKLHCFSTVLYNEAMQQRPLPGERIVVTYQGVGEARVRGQNAPKRYSFRIEGRSAAAIESMYERASQQSGRPRRGQQQGAPPPQAPAEEEIPF